MISNRRVVPRWVLLFLVVDLLLVVANAATFAITRSLHLPPIAMFRLSGESNVPTWWSSVQLLLVALVLGMLAYHVWDRRNWRSWGLWLPAAMFAFLSLDEVASMHEQVGEAFGPRGLRTGMWVAICLPLFLIGLALVTRAAWPALRGRRGVMLKLAAGMAVLVISAAGIELLANFFGDNTIGVHVCVIAEEFGEMLGATVLLWGSVDWLHTHGVRVAAVMGGERQVEPDATGEGIPDARPSRMAPPLPKLIRQSNLGGHQAAGV